MKLLLVATTAVAALLVLITVTDHWRLGALLIGVLLCVLGALRIVLPGPLVGELAVRSKVIDTAVLLSLGLALVALASTIPRGR